MKTSLRFFEDIPVRAVWDEKESKWYFSAVDITQAITKSNNPRGYWNAVKRRKNQLSTICRQLKMQSADGKYYLTDVVDSFGVDIIVEAIRTKSSFTFNGWFHKSSETIDAKSKEKAYELFESKMIDKIDVGTVNGLKQIHAFIFGGLYDFAGQIRKLNISKDGFCFATVMFLHDTLSTIENMPEGNLSQIVAKYIEMNIAHPFMEGNGRATRIWLDLILKKNLKKCVDWSKIPKHEYLSAMKESYMNPQNIYKLIEEALTEHIDDREIFMKGIDYSYYYEE